MAGKRKGPKPEASSRLPSTPRSSTRGRPARGTDDAAALWGQIADTVKPLRRRAGTAAVSQPAKKLKPAAPASDPAAPSPRPAPARAPAPAREPPAPLTPGTAPGLDKRTAQRLRRGQIQIEGRIDLHGMTRAEAHRNLTDFLTFSATAGRRCVLVITGKGMREGAGSGILRSEFPRWLNEAALRPLILSFAAAQPRDGGGGAFYVYLRRERAP